MSNKECTALYKDVHLGQYNIITRYELL